MTESINFSINTNSLLYFLVGAATLFLLIIIVARLRYLLDPPRNPMTGQLLQPMQGTGKLVGLLFIVIMVLLGAAIMFSEKSPLSVLKKDNSSPPYMSVANVIPSFIPSFPLNSASPQPSLDEINNKLAEQYDRIEFVDPPVITSSEPKFENVLKELPTIVNETKQDQTPLYSLQIKSSGNYRQIKEEAFAYAQQLHPVPVYVYRTESLYKIFVGQYFDKEEEQQQKLMLNRSFGLKSFRINWADITTTQLEEINWLQLVR